jgi:hypothetical protein
MNYDVTLESRAFLERENKKRQGLCAFAKKQGYVNSRALPVMKKRAICQNMRAYE